MATLYFDKFAGGNVDANWQTLGNWWLNRAATIPATSLPTSSDDVVMLTICSENTGSEPTVNTAILEDNFSINLTVTNGMTVINSSGVDTAIYSSITGNVIFEDDTQLDGTGTINGNASFTENSRNRGTVTGTITYNGFTGTDYLGVTYTSGRVSKFYFNGAEDISNEATPDWQTLGNWWMDQAWTIPVTGLPTSADNVVIGNMNNGNGIGNIVNSGSEPTVNSVLFFGYSSIGSSSFRFNMDISVLGVFVTYALGSMPFGSYGGGPGIGYTITGDLLAIYSEVNDGTVVGDCEFFQSSATSVTITGNVLLRQSLIANATTITGNIVIDTDAGMMTEPFMDSNYTASYDGDPQKTSRIGNTAGNGDTIVINGNCTFHNYSMFWDGTINGNCTFLDKSHNTRGVINGTATYSLSAAEEQIKRGMMITPYDVGGYSPGNPYSGMGYNVNNPSAILGEIDATTISYSGNGVDLNSVNGELTVSVKKGINGSSILGVI